MEKELTEEALRQLLEWAQRGDAFVSEQAPLVAQEIVTWGIVWHGAWSIIGLLIFLPCAAYLLWAASFVLRHGQEHHWYITGWIGLGSTASLFMSALIIGTNIQSAAQACFAPRLYVLEQVTQMIGGG